MKLQNEIWIPDEDSASFWGKNFEIREYTKLNLSGNLALDIGAHVGIWTQRLAKDFNQVIAFEPMKKHIECHRENCKGLDNVTLHTVALSNVTTNAIMTTKDINSGMSTLIHTESLKWKKEKKTEEVETTTLDSFNLPKIDFIKMDVEGWEENVLEGAEKTILTHRPTIYIEIWENKYDLVSRILKNDLKYTITKMAKANYLCQPIEET